MMGAYIILLQAQWIKEGQGSMSPFWTASLIGEIRKSCCINIVTLSDAVSLTFTKSLRVCPCVSQPDQLNLHHTSAY